VQDIDSSWRRRARVEKLGEIGVVLPIFSLFDRRLKRCFEMDKE
jgi:hypothetical protein